MSPTSYQTAPPRSSIIATGRSAVKPCDRQHGCAQRAFECPNRARLSIYNFQFIGRRASGLVMGNLRKTGAPNRKSRHPSRIVLILSEHDVSVRVTSAKLTQGKKGEFIWRRKKSP